MARGTRGRPARSLDALVRDALRQLRKLNYSIQWVQYYKRAWDRLRAFACEARLPNAWSEELLEKFLIARKVPLVGPARPDDRKMRAALSVLADYHHHGYLPRRIGQAQLPLLPAMSAGLRRYVAFRQREGGVTPAALDHARSRISGFLYFVQSRGVKKPADVQPTHIAAFVRSRAAWATDSTSQVLSSLRSFFRVSCMLGVMPADLSSAVPRIRAYSDARVPSTWSDDDIAAVLAAVERSSPLGKRDYSVLLLALRLGLRVGDIRRLRLDDIDWDHACIRIVQHKTQQPLELPLSDDLAMALIDYLRHGRPQIAHRFVFVRMKAPFDPFLASASVSYILARYRRLAGVRLEKQKGLRAFRHTLASRLLEKGVALETISSILGHQSLDSTRIYAKVDVAALRTAALDPDQVAHA